jgi:hypothetical protein
MSVSEVTPELLKHAFHAGSTLHRLTVVCRCCQRQGKIAVENSKYDALTEAVTTASLDALKRVREN